MRKAPKIDTQAQRDKLAVRIEPYWNRVMAGGYLGFRRTATGGTWIARFRHPDGRQEYNALKLALDVQPTEARDVAQREAQKWMDALTSGAIKAGSGGYKVSDAADAYVKSVRARKGEAAKADAQGRVDRKIKHVPGTERVSDLWSRRVDRLTKGEIEEWLHSMIPQGLDEEGERKAKDSANRNLTTLKAILNHAWKAERVSNPGPWSKVEPYAKVAKSRRVFLTLEQRRRLLDHTEGAFRVLLEAAMLTGARYGELRQLTVQDFDRAERKLEIHKGKTGVRTVALNDAAHGFFSRIARGKLPTAPLLARDDGMPWAHSDQDELMRAAVKRAKLPKETVFYTLRHTFIATALKGGIDIASIAKNCGTSVRIIERNYSKFIPGDVSERLNAVALV